MTMSIDVQPTEDDCPLPGRNVALSAGDSMTTETSPVVDVLFPLVDDEEWPPYPAEMVDAVLISHDLAEIAGVPWFLTNISRGDIVKVEHDGIGYVGGTVVSRGGRSTVHVMATSDEELAPVIEQLRAIGAVTCAGLVPPMLTVDVPESCSVDAVLEVLAAAESMTCAYTVACRQHRSVQSAADPAS